MIENAEPLLARPDCVQLGYLPVADQKTFGLPLHLADKSSQKFGITRQCLRESELP